MNLMVFIFVSFVNAILMQKCELVVIKVEKLIKMWLTRKQFREGVLNRDNHKCVICPRTDDLAAHHIIERRLWGECGGYSLLNGASLCPCCHLEAEQTILTCEEIREAAGITETLLPEHLYKENRVDKWGNIILPDGRRLKGELFFDESVQKILKSGGVLKDFCEYIKYPRTMHLSFSSKVTDDDRILENEEYFKEKRVIVTEKLDGENSSCYKNYMHARSIDGTNHLSRNWLKAFHGRMGYNIPDGWRVCGENMYAKHTIHYTNLETYFYVFSIWNEKNNCLNWEETQLWAELLELNLVPVLYDGIWNDDIIREFCKNDKREGFVVRIADSFSYGDFRKSVAKFVNPKFKNKLKEEDTYHWRYSAITPNKLAKND